MAPALNYKTMDNRKYAILPNAQAYTGDGPQVYSRRLRSRQYGRELYTDDEGATVREHVEALQVLEYDGDASGDLLTHLKDYHHDLSNSEALALLATSANPVYTQ